MIAADCPTVLISRRIECICLFAMVCPTTVSQSLYQSVLSLCGSTVTPLSLPLDCFLICLVLSLHYCRCFLPSSCHLTVWQPTPATSTHRTTPRTLLVLTDYRYSVCVCFAVHCTLQFKFAISQCCSSAAVQVTCEWSVTLTVTVTGCVCRWSSNQQSSSGSLTVRR